MSESTPQVAVDMRGVTKLFPGVIANEDVDLTIRVGEIHALLGENGAGKSTLMSALCGLYLPDAGEIYIATKGETQPRRVHISSPKAAIDMGIGMVHQHFKLVYPQTVAENIILGMSGVPFNLNMAQVEQDIKALSEQYKLPVDPQAFIWQLSVGEQQRVEIVKLLYRGADILILDEPTAVLTPQESEELGQTLRRMASEGKAIIFISHKLDEVMSFADRVTVLRGGKNVATVDVSETSKAGLAQLMVGREVLFRSEKENVELGPVVLSLKNIEALNDKGLPALRNVSFNIRGGEIVGLAGVAGNGQTTLTEVVTGLRKTTSGQVMIHTDDMTGQSPRSFIQAGVAHVPSDRLGMGLAGNLPVSDNLIMKAYRQRPIAAGPFLIGRTIADFSKRLIEAFQVSTPGITTPARMLSGGNQQKAILAREIMAGQSLSGGEPALLVAAYPTRGLDVGAIEAVRSNLLEQRSNGAGIFLLSEDLEELLTLSDRIAVISEGEIMGIVEPADVDIEQLGLMMAGERRATANEG
ncbi:MAG: ABC transporter ATP-binding protein, partial [Chloroflexota bacterium]